ncbi:MAG: hypothetical protein R3E39_26010 [Anaerolineae bacterium]
MSINDTLDALIASANADKTILDTLLGQLQHTTILSAAPALYLPPEQNVTSGVWTFKQLVANEGGEYLGIYKLPASDIESCLTDLTIVSHSNPASPNTAARVLPLNADPETGWVNLSSLNDLTAQPFSQFAIRSASAFEITLKVEECPTEWCYAYDFTQNDGGFSAVYGTWSSAGWVGTSAGTGVSIVVSKSITGHLTHIEMDHSFPGGSGNVAVAVNGATISLINRLNATDTTSIADVDVDITDILLNPSSGASQGSQVIMTALRLRGTGTLPAGATIC